MTDAEIKADLRRIACEGYTIWDARDATFNAALEYKDPNAREYLQFLSDKQQRLFFLLVAEAL